MTANTGWVRGGTTHETAPLAVATLRQWWLRMGCVTYPHAKALWLTAESGGRNGARGRLWKTELQKLADDTSRKMTVCHFPPGTSKWNKIAHRMFCPITGNWRGRPLSSSGVMVHLIAHTTTSTGLTLAAVAVAAARRFWHSPDIGAVAAADGAGGAGSAAGAGTGQAA